MIGRRERWVGQCQLAISTSVEGRRTHHSGWGATVRTAWICVLGVRIGLGIVGLGGGFTLHHNGGKGGGRIVRIGPGSEILGGDRGCRIQIAEVREDGRVGVDVSSKVEVRHIVSNRGGLFLTRGSGVRQVAGVV